VKDGDPTVIALRKEIKGLENTVDAVRGVADSSLVNAVVARQWKNVHDIMADCDECVTSLTGALGNPDNRQHEDILQRIGSNGRLG
jgi:hypothetical protein